MLKVFCVNSLESPTASPKIVPVLQSVKLRQLRWRLGTLYPSRCYLHSAGVLLIRPEVMGRISSVGRERPSEWLSTGRVLWPECLEQKQTLSKHPP